MCGYDIAWVGPCKNEGECPQHANLKCSSCGAPATHECEETHGFICGAPLCEKCSHTIQSNGCNSMGTLPRGLKEHCPKDAQVYKYWFENGSDAHNAAVLVQQLTLQTS
jgi:hypothetical protein